MLKKLKITQKNAHIYFMIPGIIFFLVFGLYPIVYGVVLSFTDKVGTSTPTFVGFENYIRAFNDTIFLKSLVNIFKIFIIHAPLMIFLSLVFASILNSPKTLGKNFFKSALFLPNVTSAVALTLFFKLFFTDNGILDQIILFFNSSYESLSWLGDEQMAVVTVGFTIVWRWMGYNMVIFLATMQNISEEIYEAATIDAAGKIKQFFKITVPLMRNPILFTTIMTVSGTLGLMAEVQLLTGGGPNYATMTPSLYIYNTVWSGSYEFAYGAAMGMIISVIVILLSVLQFWIGREKND